MFSKTDDKSRTDTSGSTGQFSRGTSATPSLISGDLKVIGNLESSGDLQIDGKVEGDIKSRSVTVGESAEVKGAIVADTARICGTVKGKVQASSVTLANTAKAKGDIVHQTLSIEAGAEFEGQVRRLDSERARGDVKVAAQKPIEPSGAAKVATPAGGVSNGGAEGKPAAR